jgi:hypothetical protein
MNSANLASAKIPLPGEYAAKSAARPCIMCAAITLFHMISQYDEAISLAHDQC